MAKGTNETEYRNLLSRIHQNLDDREFHTLKFLCKDESINLKQGRLDDCKNCFGVFEMLEKKTLISKNDLWLLVEILDLIDRSDLKREVEELHGTTVPIRHRPRPTISPYRKMLLQYADEINVDDFELLKQSLGNMFTSQIKAELKYPIQMMQAFEKQGKIAPGNVGFLFEIAKTGDGRSNREKIVKGYKKEVVIGQYEMNSKPHGLCIIINNIDFSQQTNLEDRTGSENDQEKLKETFTKLNFKVIEKINLKAQEMKDLMEWASEQNHSNKYDCFVCCIMSHGNLGVVTGTDGKTVQISEMAEPMTSSKCPKLIYKPKLFFIESCRGQDYDTKYDPNSASYFTEDDSNYNSMVGSNDGDTQQQGEGSVPEDADFLFAYASSPGKKAKLKHSGSVYINKLTEVLNEYHEDFDILSLLTLVNKEVCKEEFSEVSSPGTTFGQSPSSQFTLRKKLYFY